MAHTQNLPGNKDSEQTILNHSFDKDFNVLAFENLAYDGSSLQRVNTDNLAVKITESGNYTYIGVAAPGTAQSTAKWQAKRIDESVSGTTVITWADGDTNFDNVATDLTALSYS